MSDQQRLINTLGRTSVLLLEIRKFIADSGHLKAMVEIDTLLSVAQSETDRSIAVAISQQPHLSET